MFLIKQKPYLLQILGIVYMTMDTYIHSLEKKKTNLFFFIRFVASVVWSISASVIV